MVGRGWESWAWSTILGTLDSPDTENRALSPVLWSQATEKEKSGTEK